MKYIVLILLITVLNAQVSYCQKIHFCDTTNQWITFGHDTIYGGEAISFFKIRPWSGSYWPLYGGLAWNYYYDLDDSFSLSGHLSTQDYTVREDTDLGIVYIYSLDTEYILYNYNLHFGDTVHQHYFEGVDSCVYQVVQLDSVVINGVYHKKFTMHELDTVHPYRPGWDTLYTYVEGIGSLFKPISNTRDLLYNHALLHCFTNQGIQPVVDISFPYPSMTDTEYFTNSCIPVETANAELVTSVITLSPNPATSQVTITGATNSDVRVYDGMGREVMRYRPQTETVDIDVSHLVPGFYLVHIGSRDKSVSKKLIIER